MFMGTSDGNCIRRILVETWLVVGSIPHLITTNITNILKAIMACTFFFGTVGWAPSAKIMKTSMKQMPCRKKQCNNFHYIHFSFLLSTKYNDPLTISVATLKGMYGNSTSPPAVKKCKEATSLLF